MVVIEVGKISKPFRDISVKTFERFASEYETKNISFSICGNEKDVYFSFNKFLSYLNLPEQKNPARLLTRVDALAIVSLIMADNNMYHLIYTCEERANGTKDLEASLFYSIKRCPIYLRKKLPSGIII